jgi:hypothetical protein
MKTMKFATFFLSLSMVLAANVLLAKRDPEKVEKHDEETRSMLAQLGVLAISSAALHRVSTAHNWRASTQSLMHAANIFWQLGRIFDRPVFSELGIKTLLASGAAAVANNPFVLNNVVPMLPLVGPDLANAGGHTVGILTVATYELAKSGYNTALDQAPASVQYAIRGKQF